MPDHSCGLAGPQSLSCKQLLFTGMQSQRTCICLSMHAICHMHAWQMLHRHVKRAMLSQGLRRDGKARTSCGIILNSGPTELYCGCSLTRRDGLSQRCSSAECSGGRRGEGRRSEPGENESNSPYHDLPFTDPSGSLYLTTYSARFPPTHAWPGPSSCFLVLSSEGGVTVQAPMAQRWGRHRDP